jgi:hypothetical protein
MVQFDESRLAEYCRRHGITRLRLFGSAVRGEDSPESDVDLIADFGVPVGYFELIRAEDELTEFFGRPVDLLTEPAISRYMRDEVLASAQVILPTNPDDLYLGHMASTVARIAEFVERVPRGGMASSSVTRERLEVEARSLPRRRRSSGLGVRRSTAGPPSWTLVP